jgi:hypothetical protein
MKTFTLTFALTVAAVLTAIAAAQPSGSHQSAPKTLTVVMHDPGCHWFAAGTRFAKTASATGSVRVLNLDEAALVAKSATVTKRIPVGAKVLLGRGRYVITMVGQAPDDNHLKLTVS